MNVRSFYGTPWWNRFYEQPTGDFRLHPYGYLLRNRILFENAPVKYRLPLTSLIDIRIDLVNQFGQHFMGNQAVAKADGRAKR